MGQRKHKPSDPQAIMRQRAAQTRKAETEAEIARLRAQGAVVTLDRARRIVGAYRKSPFVKLREAKTITNAQAAAAERLCQEWAEWRGLDGRPAPSFEVRGETSTQAELITARMLKAGKLVRDVLGRVGPLDRELLKALAEAAVETDRPIPWREIVQRVTGVTQTVRQSQMIVSALENLSRAYALH